MCKNDRKSVTDITGIKLSPGQPYVCLGNGKQEYESCCDECDHFLLCFPDDALRIRDKFNRKN